ncbi:hypothetical protein [Ornithinibacillus sp. 179-J 7C1 HS]|uniref:hypothetical protein n=1 Tax=Ornithinibacillus sp. 179-J 7C1 HS TaxID=3142384 RepID=UPI0039A2529A
MNEENRKKYLHLFLGYLAMLLIGVAMLRQVAIYDDSLGMGLTLLGLVFLVSYFNFTEVKMGITKTQRMLFRGCCFVILVLLALLLFI